MIKLTAKTFSSSFIGSPYLSGHLPGNDTFRRYFTAETVIFIGSLMLAVFLLKLKGSSQIILI
jgi:hypothetical protein